MKASQAWHPGSVLNLKSKQNRLLLATAFFAFSGATWSQEVPDLKYRFELRERYYSIDKGAGGDEPGSGYDGSRSYFAHRALLALGLHKGERLGAHFTLLHAMLWGRASQNAQADVNSNYGPNSDDSQAATPDGTGNSDNLLLVNEANGWWKASDSVTLKLGRSGLTIGDGSVIGRNNWEQVPTSFDGGFVNWDMDKMNLDIFAARLENLPRRSHTGIDANNPVATLAGFSLDGKMLPEWLTLLNAHFIQQNSSQTTRANLPDTGGIPDNSVIQGLGKNIQRVGVAMKAESEHLDFRLSGAFMNGRMYQKPAEEISVRAYMADVEAGYRFPRFIGLRFYGNFHLDSGDLDVSYRNGKQSSSGADNNWNRYEPLFYDQHSFGGRMELIAWGNLTYYKGGVTASPFEGAVSGFNYIKYQRSSGNDVPTAGRLGGELLTGITPDSDNAGSLDLGEEMNLTFDYQLDEGLTAGVEAGVFYPGTYLTHATNAVTGKTGENRIGENIRIITAQIQYQF